MTKQSEFSKIVLTGAPGSGKTAIRLSLEIQGESTIGESAEDAIKYYLALGVGFPTRLEEFQQTIGHLQCHRENFYDRQNLNNGRVFLDRSIFDGFAYRVHRSQWECDDLLTLLDRLKLDEYAENVFFVMGLQSIEQTNVRLESLEEAMKIEALLLELYTYLGFTPIMVPYEALRIRTQFVLTHCENVKSLGAKKAAQLKERIVQFLCEKRRQSRIMLDEPTDSPFIDGASVSCSNI